MFTRVSSQGIVFDASPPERITQRLKNKYRRKIERRRSKIGVDGRFKDPELSSKEPRNRERWSYDYADPSQQWFLRPAARRRQNLSGFVGIGSREMCSEVASEDGPCESSELP